MSSRLQAAAADISAPERLKTCDFVALRGFFSRGVFTRKLASHIIPLLRIENMKEILTTTDVAKLLGLHVNTLKNWARNGKLPSFRTIGGHYRIRVDQLIESLNKNGIPVPEELLVRRNKKVFITHQEAEIRDGLAREIGAVGPVDIECFKCGVDTLMEMGRDMPSVVIWSAGLKDVDAGRMIVSLREKALPHRVDVMLIGDSSAPGVDDIPDALAEVPVFNYPDNVPEMKKWLQRVVG
jgi:excisionase family DNA binding protein